MAHLKKVGERWRAEVCVDRKRRAKTFQTKREAARWAAEQEDRGLLAANHTLRTAIEKYLPIAESHAGSQAELSRLRALVRDLDCIDTPLDQLTPAMLAQWRDKRLGVVAPVSVRREQIILSSLLNVAVREWGWLRENPLRTVKRPPTSKPRRRGIKQAEIDAICRELDGVTSGPQTRALFILSLETGMRMSELTGLRWSDVSEKTVTLRDTKNGDAREVPLSPAAREVIKSRVGMDADFVFTRSSQQMGKVFAAAADRAGCGDVHFHDARSEAITRLARKLDVLQLARMIGHRDLKSLMIYYAESPESIADRL